MAENTLPRSVVEDDHRLDAAASKVGEELAQLRWHWTIDESNLARVSIRQYAKSVERNEATIRATVRGYEAWTAGGASRTSLAGAIQLAGMSVERAAATEAVAAALGNSVGATARGHREEVKQVLSAAREAAEKKGTDVHDEIGRVARGVAVGRKVAAERNERKPVSVTYAQLELKLGTASRALTEALLTARTSHLDAEVIELVTVTLGNIRALLGLIDMAVAGTVAVDWDAELERIGGAS